MIYEFLLRNEFNDTKKFLLTADSLSQLYRRILDTYRTSKEDVVLIAEYEETPDWSYKLKKQYIKTDSEDIELINKSKELFNNASRKCEPYKSDAINKYKYDLIPISSSDDIKEIILKNTYKKIKVYWELGEKRGQHLYYVLAK